jgi:hypothetical protein
MLLSYVIRWFRDAASIATVANRQLKATIGNRRGRRCYNRRLAIGATMTDRLAKRRREQMFN